MWSEPPQPSEPQFELDDTETIAMPEPEPHVPAYVERPAVSAWDADEDEEPVTTAKMPAWDTPPREPLSVPMPAEIEPPADADEEQWGFDEAQLETVRRASVPLRDRELEPPPDDLDLVDPAAAPPPRAGRRYGFIVALLAIVILAAAGYGAFLWWQARDAASSEPLAVTRSPRVQRPPVTAPTTTSSATEASLTQTSPTQSSVGTTTPAPNAATSTTANAALTTTALPKVVTSSAPPTSAVSTTMAPAMIARNTPPPATAPRTTPSATPPSSAAAPARQPMRVTATQPASAASVPATDTQPLPTFTRKAPPAATTRTRDQYDAMARDYAANATGNYTVQIQILCQESNLAGAIRSGGSEVWFVPQTIAGRACYRVFWGRYATRDAAQSAMALIPASLRDRSAAVKPVPKH
jgi:septal ring-binding cell division protein DamX